MQYEIAQKGPDNNHKVTYTASEYRSFQATMALKVSCIACFVMLLGNIIFSLALLQLAKAVHVDSAIISTQNNTGQMIDIEPVASDMNGVDILNDTMLRFYIKTRHTTLGDIDTLSFNWLPKGIIQRMSNPTVYKAFYRAPDYGEKRTLTQKVMDVRYKKVPLTEVEIISVRKVTDNLWSVDFDTIQYDELAAKEQRKRWNASVRANNYSSRQVFSPRFTNPLGFVVTEYNIAPKLVK